MIPWVAKEPQGDQVESLQASSKAPPIRAGNGLRRCLSRKTMQLVITHLFQLPSLSLQTGTHL